MSGLAVRVTNAALQKVKALKGQLADFTPVMEEIGAAMLSEVDLSFRNEQDPWGTPWAPLSTETTLPMRRKGKGQGAAAKILRDTGLMANSFSYRLTKKGVEVGTTDVKSGTHQYGAKQGAYGASKHGPIPWGDIPARPMLPIRNGVADLPHDVELEIIDIVLAHLELT